MRFGYLLSSELGPDQDPAKAVREALAEARAAEDAGFDGVFVPEHHGPLARYLPGVIPLMYMLTQVTTKLDVGSAVLLLPLAQPARVAEEIALLDHISNGRVILGVGLGYLASDFDYFGLEQQELGARMEDGIALMRALWSGRQVNHAGRFHTCRDGVLFPAPLSKGGPPLWVAGRSVKGARRAARLGDAWIIDATPRLSSLEDRLSAYRAEAAALGRRTLTAVIRDAWLDLGDSADQRYREAALAAHRAKLAAGVYAVDPQLAELDPSQVSFAQFSEDRWLTGSANEIRATLDEWHSLIDLDYMLLRFRPGRSPEHRMVLEQLRAFGELIIHPSRTSTDRAPRADDPVSKPSVSP
jgi:alkanesulfonate monooxygenase SsuD/methylene tetrahydromethanopterin reductase-like flavin-dependent oxidoreductase (luciferase family)